MTDECDSFDFSTSYISLSLFVILVTYRICNQVQAVPYLPDVVRTLTSRFGIYPNYHLSIYSGGKSLNVKCNILNNETGN